MSEVMYVSYLDGIRRQNAKLGYQTKALWVHYDQSVSHDFVQEQQLMNVQIYSLASFFGRIFSGMSLSITVSADFTNDPKRGRV